MKILIWTNYCFPSIGGLEVMTHSLAKELKTLGHEVIIISTNVASDECQSILIDDIKIYAFPFVRALIYKNLLLVKIVLTQVSQLIQAYAPDIINVHGWFENLAFYQTRILEALNYPFFLTIHGLIEQENYRSLACKKLFARAKKVNAVSHAILQSLRQQEIQHAMPMRVIYNGLALPDLPIQPYPTSVAKLVMVGRLSEEKGFETVFHALPYLIKKYPSIHLTLVGGGFRYQELDRLKKDLNLTQYIEMTDFVRPGNAVYQYIDQANLMLIPSNYEPFGLVSLEAGLRARPVIASDVPGLNEVIVHNETGILVAPKDSEVWAEAIDAMLSDPARMQTIGISANKRVLKYYHVNAMTQQYLDMYLS